MQLFHFREEKHFYFTLPFLLSQVLRPCLRNVIAIIINVAEYYYYLLYPLPLPKLPPHETVALKRMMNLRIGFSMETSPLIFSHIVYGRVVVFARSREFNFQLYRRDGLADDGGEQNTKRKQCLSLRSSHHHSIT